MIIKYDEMCASVHLFTVICTDDVIVHMCPCMLLVKCAAAVLCVDMWILQSYG